MHGRRLRLRLRMNADSLLYLTFGGGLLAGAAGGDDFDRSNPALSGTVGYELPVGSALGLAVELAVDFELAGEDVRGAYAGVLGRVRIGYFPLPKLRLWAALGVGSAGYQVSSIAGGIAAGTTLLFVPAFGLDLSGSLTLLAPATDETYDNIGVRYEYDGGLVLSVVLRGAFEIHL